MKWKETNKHVFHTIYLEHSKDLGVFGTCTLPEGDPRLGKMNPYILTEWGFKDADEPIMKSVATKENRQQKKYDYKYYIAIYQIEE